MTTPNSIGMFIIGESSIGTPPVFDVTTTVISQYANSPILMQLIENLSAYFEPEQNLDNFYDAVFSIDSALGPALEAWGRLVGVQRVLPVAVGGYFGFSEMGAPDAVGFDQAPFYSGQALTSNYKLSNSAFRLLILIKAAFNLTDCSIQSINNLLLSLFPNRGVCYVIDNQDMSMTYKFTFSLTPVEQSIVISSGVLPRPSGVSVSYTY